MYINAYNYIHIRYVYKYYISIPLFPGALYIIIYIIINLKAKR